MEALFEIFMIGGIIGGGAYLFLSWQEGRKNVKEKQDTKMTSNQEKSDKWFSFNIIERLEKIEQAEDKSEKARKTKMLRYYNNSPRYYWFQIIGFGLIWAIPISVVIYIYIEIIFEPLIYGDNELMGMYILCFLFLSIWMHRHYQK